MQFSFSPWLLAGLLAAPCLSRAQAPDTTTTYKHQLGLTASPVLDGFFRNNRSLPLGLLYKRQLAPNRALRLRLVGQYSSRDTSNYLPVLPGSYQRRWQALGYVGHEWQRRIRNGWGWGYGLEVGGGLTRQERRRVENGTNELGRYELDSKTVVQEWQVQARPFAYLRYALTGRLAVWLETAAPLTYQTYDERTESTGMLTTPAGYLPAAGYPYYKNSRTTLSWRPVQLIGITATF